MSIMLMALLPVGIVDVCVGVAVGFDVGACVGADVGACVGADQGGRGWLAFGDRSRIPQSFRRARICKFSRQKRYFLQLRENRPFVVVKRLTHTQVLSLKQSNTLFDV